jgi:hypothetical protein
MGHSMCTGKSALADRRFSAAGSTTRDLQRDEVIACNAAGDRRAPILKAYLQRAPGARPHVAVDWRNWRAIPGSLKSGVTLLGSGDRIVAVLQAQGVRFLFTLCGGHISPILTAAKARGIRVVDRVLAS